MTKKQEKFLSDLIDSLPESKRIFKEVQWTSEERQILISFVEEAKDANKKVTDAIRAFHKAGILEGKSKNALFKCYRRHKKAMKLQA